MERGRYRVFQLEFRLKKYDRTWLHYDHPSKLEGVREWKTEKKIPGQLMPELTRMTENGGSITNPDRPL